jgi:hypothetical protein
LIQQDRCKLTLVDDPDEKPGGDPGMCDPLRLRACERIAAFAAVHNAGSDMSVGLLESIYELAEYGNPGTGDLAELEFFPVTVPITDVLHDP